MRKLEQKYIEIQKNTHATFLSLHSVRFTKEVAIKFSEWLVKNYIQNDNGWSPKYKDDWFTTEELLEEFLKTEL